MTLSDLRNIYNHCGWPSAANAIEEAVVTREERNELYDELERLDYEKRRRWTHPSRYPAAYDPHQF